MKHRDYYETLGVPRDADSKQIHQAYRRKARELHPDKNKGDPQAEEKFKELGEAYRILSNPQMRKQYDMFGSVGGDYAPPPGWESSYQGFDFQNFDNYNPFQHTGRGVWEEFIGSILGRFGTGFRSHSSSNDWGKQHYQAERKRGSDIEVELPLEVEDLFDERPRKIAISVVRPCTRCGGTGRSGNMICEKCSGSGRVTLRKVFKVRIPRGLGNGDVIRLAGQGNPAPGGAGSPGDLLVRLKVKPHSRYRIKGHNLELDLEVPDHLAVLGGRVEFDSPTGKLALQLPAGCTAGKKLRLKGKGLPMRQGGFGDLFVNLKIKVPENLSEKQKELYKKLRDLQK